jgi:hypothetical protein
MTPGFQFSNLRRVRVHEYLLRFLLGGLVTVATGLIAHIFGPQAGGLFLAFPAIFPASATLIEKHEAEKKRSHGSNGTLRGKHAAALDARGAALGSIGLAAFAASAAILLPGDKPALVLIVATGIWFVVAMLARTIRRAI